MADMSDLAVAVAKLKAAKDIAESINDTAASQQRQSEFISKLLDAYGALFKAKEERSALLQRIREFESIDVEKQRYELVSLAPHVVAFALKQDVRSNEPPHYLCANCFYAGRISFLQQHTSGQYWDKYACNTCKEELSVDKGAPRQGSALPPVGAEAPKGGWAFKCRKSRSVNPPAVHFRTSVVWWGY